MLFAPVLDMLCKPQAFRRWLRPVTVAGMLCAMGAASGGAHASMDAVMQVNQLLEQGKTQEAALRVQSALKQNSNDVQMRFLQGVVAAEQRKYDQAIQVFTALTQDYPGLPEPYNNLAVLHAAKGDERKAAQVLEQAIRTNPSYATAHENLGDLYARMASDAYAKALQLDGSRQAIQPKLSLIKQIFPASASSSPAAAAPAVATAVPAAPVVPAVQVAAKPVESATAKDAAATPLAASTPAAPEKAAKPAEPTQEQQQRQDERKQAVAAVEKAVAAWAKAWEQQNMTAYYAAYSHQFEPQGSSLAAWKTERKDRIVGKPAITLEVRDLKIALQGDRATANFRQHYASGSYKATARKTLSLQREGDKWRILREGTGR